jgi:hypothetical protein
LSVDLGAEPQAPHRLLTGVAGGYVDADVAGGALDQGG